MLLYLLAFNSVLKLSFNTTRYASRPIKYPQIDWLWICSLNKRLEQHLALEGVTLFFDYFWLSLKSWSTYDSIFVAWMISFLLIVNVFIYGQWFHFIPLRSTRKKDWKSSAVIRGYKIGILATNTLNNKAVILIYPRDIFLFWFKKNFLEDLKIRTRYWQRNIQQSTKWSPKNDL